MAIIETNVISAQSFQFAGGGTIEFDFAHVGADLGAVGDGVHAQRAADAAGNADQSFHAAQIALRAEGDHAAEVGRSVHVSGISFDAHSGLRRGEMQDDVGKLAVGNQYVGAAAEKAVRDIFVREQVHHVRNGFEFAEQKLVGGAANAERGFFAERHAGAQFAAEFL